MPALDFDMEQPLSIGEEGTIRVGGSRVALDSIVNLYQQGATAEEIALRFPALSLADVHTSLAYYLNNPKLVEDYLLEQAGRADELRERIARDPAQQKGLAQVRDRLQRRLADQKARSS